MDRKTSLILAGVIALVVCLFRGKWIYQHFTVVLIAIGIALVAMLYLSRRGIFDLFEWLSGE